MHKRRLSRPSRSIIIVGKEVTICHNYADFSIICFFSNYRCFAIKVNRHGWISLSVDTTGA